MITKYSADRVLGDIIVAGATLANNIASFLLDNCEVTRAGANIQRLEILDSGDGLFYVVERTLFSVLTERFTYAWGASEQSRRLPKEDADQIKNIGSQTDRITNKRL